MKPIPILFHKSPPKNIIVRMPNWLGDCVMATPILADLHRHFPQAKITAMCRGQTALLLEKNPHVHEIFRFEKPSGWLHRSQLRNILLPLRHGRYDLGILLTNSFSSAWWFFRGNVQNRIGYATNIRRWLLARAIPKDTEENHQVITYKMLLCCLGIPVSDTPPQLYLSETEHNNAWNRLKKYGMTPDHILIGINPGAAYGSAKCWIPERFKEVIQQLLQRPEVFVLCFGDAAGKPLVDDICRGLPNRVVNFAGATTVRELIALIHCCDVLLTNDSGPMHIAAALQKPLVALFGSTNATATGPYQAGKVIHKHVACSPCYLRECPLDFRCMKQITVSEVVHELNQTLEKDPEVACKLMKR